MRNRYSGVKLVSFFTSPVMSDCIRSRASPCATCEGTRTLGIRWGGPWAPPHRWTVYRPHLHPLVRQKIRETGCVPFPPSGTPIEYQIFEIVL